jgi:hypothetical protein
VAVESQFAEGFGIEVRIVAAAAVALEVVVPSNCCCTSLGEEQGQCKTKVNADKGTMMKGEFLQPWRFQ